MASTHSIKGNDVEMTVSPSFSTTDKQDDLALARLGKKAVLKVCLHVEYDHIIADRSLPASIWFSLNLGL